MKGEFMANQTNSLAHTKWMCKYHIVFIPKYRRKVIYNQYRADLQEIIRTLCKYKGVEILEGHMMPDHVHLLLSIPPKMSVSSFMGYLKGKSALMMFCSKSSGLVKIATRGSSSPNPAISMAAPMQRSRTNPTKHHLSRGVRICLRPLIISQMIQERIALTIPLFCPDTHIGADIFAVAAPFAGG